MHSTKGRVPWGSVHVHSAYSAHDALSRVPDLIDAAVHQGWGALGLTDHGTVAGIAELYTGCRRAGIVPVPGIEAYITFDRNLRANQAWHMLVLATDARGWDNLIRLNNLAQRQYFHRPFVDLADLVRLGQQGLLQGLTATTACYFGIVQKPLRAAHPRVQPGFNAALNVLEILSRAFDGRVLVEYQRHFIEGDPTHDEVATGKVLVRLADRVGLPMIVTTDAHYTHIDEQPDHEMLKRLFSFSADDDATFPGTGYSIVAADDMRDAVGEEMWARGKEGFDWLMDSHDLVLPGLDSYTARVPQVRGLRVSAEEELRNRVEDALEAAGGAPPNVRHRVETEMDVILGQGFAPYLLLTAEVTEYCRQQGIQYMTRGSASGSYVNYLLGISQVEPIKWRCLFERFLTKDRASPPDVDIDVEQDRRQEVLDHMAEKYATCHVGTWPELRLEEVRDDFGEGTSQAGSLIVRWKILFRKTMELAEARARDIEAAQSREAAEQYIAGVKSELVAMRGRLPSLADHRPLNKQGKNAAGILVVDSEADLEVVPQQWIASSGTMVTAWDKNQLERLGYVKVDVLGLATLTAYRDMLAMTGIAESDIPLDDPATYRLIRSGNTAGVFQLSGYTQKKGVKRLKPRNLEHIVIALALFRPQAMKSGNVEEYLTSTIADRRMAHPIIDRHVKATKGFAIFQEQVISILRDLGMTPEELKTVLKAVKASNSGVDGARETMDRVRREVGALTKEAGFSAEDEQWLDNALRSYAEYSFNRSHAVSYAFLSYRTAWFKANHPLVFWTATLNAFSEDTKRQAELYRMMRTEKLDEPIFVLPPSVSKSGAGYTAVPRIRAVRKGLVTIAGVGKATAMAIESAQPYTSMRDFCERVPASQVSGTKHWLAGQPIEECSKLLQALADAGALDEFDDLRSNENGTGGER